MRTRTLSTIVTILMILFCANVAEGQSQNITKATKKAFSKKQIFEKSGQASINEILNRLKEKTSQIHEFDWYRIQPIPTIDTIKFNVPKPLPTPDISHLKFELPQLFTPKDFIKRLKEEYTTACNMHLQQPVIWFRLGNTAAYYDLDSIATDCFNRYESTLIHFSELYRHIPQLHQKGQKYITPIVNRQIEKYFSFYTNYWLHRNGNLRQLEFNINLLDSLSQYASTEHADLTKALKAVINDSTTCHIKYKEALQNYATNPGIYNHKTAKTLSAATISLITATGQTELYSEILNLHDKLALKILIGNDFTTSYYLFMMALITRNESVNYYYYKCVGLDESQFNERWQNYFLNFYQYVVKKPENLSDIDYLLFYHDAQLSLCEQLCYDMYFNMIENDSIFEKNIYCSDKHLAHKEAILYVANKADSIAGDNFSINIAMIHFLRGSANALFEDTSDEGCQQIMDIYNQLYEMRNNAEYQPYLIMFGISHADFIDKYKGRTKDAEKTFKNMIPIIKKSNDESMIGESLDIIINFYKRHNKNKEAKKMQDLQKKLAPSYTPGNS